MCLERFNGRRQRMHFERCTALAGDCVDHQRQRGDVVEVRMREKDVVDPKHFVEAEIAMPVPASISTSSSIKNEVVRQPLAIAPEHPSTRTFMVKTVVLGALTGRAWRGGKAACAAPEQAHCTRRPLIFVRPR